MWRSLDVRPQLLHQGDLARLPRAGQQHGLLPAKAEGRRGPTFLATERMVSIVGEIGGLSIQARVPLRSRRVGTADPVREHEGGELALFGSGAHLSKPSFFSNST